MHRWQGPPHDGRHDPRLDSCRAPQMRTGTAVASRTPNGIGNCGNGGSAIVPLRTAKLMKSNQSWGASAKETPMSTALAVAPIAAARHSPRSGCHHQPIAAVIFVTSSIAHECGMAQRHDRERGEDPLEIADQCIRQEHPGQFRADAEEVRDAEHDERKRPAPGAVPECGERRGRQQEDERAAIRSAGAVSRSGPPGAGRRDSRCRPRTMSPDRGWSMSQLASRRARQRVRRTSRPPAQGQPGCRSAASRPD